ncbi:hypothetical protein [uncultured Cyclobacterium sp.]|uniref:hypothetical protein n=1 Tax=uncultured Cyclobacterium sp. TaxID=453820 RepID=UPI0030EC5CF7|tara:strand:+ start:271317 stop:271670 length:354 start_codon:yes stop_codon:yes gene_type:complete
MEKNYVAYSSILIQFIQPLLNGSETENEYLTKAKMGIIAWNYHVSDQNKLPYNKEMKSILKQMTKANYEGRKMLNLLVSRKEAKFNNYKQLLTNVEIRRKPDNSATLYVESYPADKI